MPWLLMLQKMILLIIDVWIMMNSCKLRGIWKGDNCSWMWCKPKPEKTFFEIKNAKTVLHVC